MSKLPSHLIREDITADVVGSQIDRVRIGNPQLRLPASPRAGQIVEVRTKVDHDSNTGLALKGGKMVREQPEFYVKDLLVYRRASRLFDDLRVARADGTYGRLLGKLARMGRPPPR